MFWFLYWPYWRKKVDSVVKENKLMASEDAELPQHTGYVFQGKQRSLMPEKKYWHIWQSSASLSMSLSH